MSVRLFVFLVALLAAGGALAQSGEDAADDFAALDADKSGGLSHKEVQAVAPDLTRADFSIYDSDGSGELSRTEFAVFVAERSE